MTDTRNRRATKRRRRARLARWRAAHTMVVVIKPRSLGWSRLLLPFLGPRSHHRG